jgi:hypothetical protein
MSNPWSRWVICIVSLSLLHTQAALAARDRAEDKVEVGAYVNDSCVIADEPFFVPVAADKDGSDQTAKFLPLLGIVIGKLAELFINHEIQASADRMKAGAARKDTHYAVSRHMNLYRADFQPAPSLSINAKLGCMTIVAARFKPEPADCRAEYLPKELAPQSMNLAQTEWKTTRTDDSIENQLRRANVCVVGKVHAVYEARFEFSKDGTAYRLEDAGYHIESLLTTRDLGASRTTLYTLKISDPSATDQQEVLSSAWVNIGTVSAGTHSSGGKGETAPWLRVPPMSVEARRSYEDKTRVHQEVIGEIEALQRALTRNQRLLASLDQRIVTASPDLADGLKQERTRIAVQNQAQGAELEARNAEYQDLPRTPLEFMPVTIEVAVTESESEKKARLALADIIGKNSGTVASAVGDAATGLLSKSVDVADIKTEADSADLASELGAARDLYFDALVDAQTRTTGSAREDSQHRLIAAKNTYNTLRRSHGLEPIK